MVGNKYRRKQMRYNGTHRLTRRGGDDTSKGVYVCVYVCPREGEERETLLTRLTVAHALKTKEMK